MALSTSDSHDGLNATGVVASAPVGPFTLLGGRYGIVVSGPRIRSAASLRRSVVTPYWRARDVLGLSPEKNLLWAFTGMSPKEFKAGQKAIPYTKDIWRLLTGKADDR